MRAAHGVHRQAAPTRGEEVLSTYVECGERRRGYSREGGSGEDGELAVECDDFKPWPAASCDMSITSHMWLFNIKQHALSVLHK